MILFLMSDSFTERMILYKINYLLNWNIEEVILLRENHLQGEVFVTDEIAVTIKENIDECVESSDNIIIVKSLCIEPRTIDYVLQKAQNYNKECFVIDNCFEDIQLKSKGELYSEFKQYPTVLNIALGMDSQPYCMEILLNRIFEEKRIKFKQIFTEETKRFLWNLNSYGVLNFSYAQQLEADRHTNAFNIVVWTLNIGNNMKNLKYWIEHIRCISPDYIIFQTDNTFKNSNIQSINEFLKVGGINEIDTFVKSRYGWLNGENRVYYAERKEGGKDIWDLEDGDLRQKLSFDILSKIGLPEKMVAY